MLQAIGNAAGLRVLDAGCAGGFYSFELAKTAAHVDAVDASSQMIEIVASKKVSNVEAHEHDLSEPFHWIADESVDLVVSSLVLHYLFDWRKTLHEFDRILHRDARLIFSVHHPAMTGPTVDNYFETQRVTEVWNIGGREQEVSFYHRSMETIVNDVIANGFELVRMIEPRLETRTAATEAERRLATRPWFLIIEARRNHR